MSANKGIEDVYVLATRIVRNAIREAELAGYEWLPCRDVFTYSDTLGLTDEIVDWLENHMRRAA